MRSPVRWFGGKGNMMPKLLPLIPQHRQYCEVFGGGASLLFAKQPAKAETYNDLDGGLVNFYRVLQDPDKFDRFYRKVQVTPYSREIFNDYRESWDDTGCEIERAYRWFVLARMSFGAHFGTSWGYSRTTSRRNMAGETSRWLGIIDGLPAIHQRIMRVQIEHDDFRNVIKNYDDPQAFFYLDPPYVHSTRSDGKYAHEMTDDDQGELIDILLGVEGKVMLSGYANPIYAQLEDAGWKRKDWETTCYAAGKTRLTGILGDGSAKEKQLRTETVWMNYELQMELF